MLVTGGNPVKKWLATIVSTLLCAGLLVSAGCNREKAMAGGAPAMPPPVVSVVNAVVRDVPVYLDEIGACAARESVTITPQIAGIITGRHFKDGEDLKKDQPLFTIDPRPFQAALDAANAQ